MQKYIVVFIVGLAIGIGGTLYLSRGYIDQSITNAESEFNTKRDELSSRLDNAIRKTKDAEIASANASRLLVEYRESVERADRERREELERLIGKAGEGGIGAKEITDGLDGDIEVTQSIQRRSIELESGIRRLQKSYAKQDKSATDRNMGL